MSSPGGLPLVRRAGVYGLSTLLALAGCLLAAVAAAEHHPVVTPFGVPWWALAPAYLAALQMPLHYEFRQHSRASTLTQIPMAFGLVFLGPWPHLAARVTASIADMAIRRTAPIKAVYNICLGAAEVGIATALLSSVSGDNHPGAVLWGAIVTGVVASDVITAVVVMGVLWLVQVPQTWRDLLDSVTSAAVTSVAFTAVGIVAVAASWTDASTIALAALFAACLAVAFRRHRRLSAEAVQQGELQNFLKGLGPLDLASPQAFAVLEHVRTLMHAVHLDVTWQEGETWRQASLSEGDTAMSYSAVQPETKIAAAGTADLLSSPLVGARGPIGVLRVRERMGSARPFGLRDVRLLEAVSSEVSGAIERGQMQRELALAATTDPLTGLPNLNESSRLLDDLLDGEGSDLVIAAVAVDSFREVNDTLGHEVGDELLLEVTRRLRLTFPHALLGRIGGGRFLVVTSSDSVGHDPAMFGLGLRAQVEGGAQLGPVGTHIRLSVGCVRAPDHGNDSATLIRRAETAMYGARHAQGGPVVWEPVYEVEGQRRLAVVMALREALASGAIGVAFQPKVAAGGDKVTGVEALARWTHPALGAISPAEFVPLAEAAGLMGPLTSSVLRQALTACKGWQRRGGRIGVAVNVSAASVLDPSFVTEIAAILTSVNVSPDLLTLELTEGVVVDDPALAAVRMAELHALGVKLSVDDFGTGYSSLTYLKGLPVDEVKVDKGFIDGIAHDDSDRAVVRAVVDIAHTLGLRVVAEGIEHAEQDQVLAALGVDEVQGYLHARPMAALDMAYWLRGREAATAQT